MCALLFGKEPTQAKQAPLNCRCSVKVTAARCASRPTRLGYRDLATETSRCSPVI
jgi:hypothetical protein